MSNSPVPNSSEVGPVLRDSSESLSPNSLSPMSPIRQPNSFRRPTETNRPSPDSIDYPCLHFPNPPIQGSFQMTFRPPMEKEYTDTSSVRASPDSPLRTTFTPPIEDAASVQATVCSPMSYTDIPSVKLFGSPMTNSDISSVSGSIDSPMADMSSVERSPAYSNVSSVTGSPSSVRGSPITYASASWMRDAPMTGIPLVRSSPARYVNALLVRRSLGLRPRGTSSSIVEEANTGSSSPHGSSTNISSVGGSPMSDTSMSESMTHPGESQVGSIFSSPRTNIFYDGNSLMRYPSISTLRESLTTNAYALSERGSLDASSIEVVRDIYGAPMTVVTTGKGPLKRYTKVLLVRSSSMTDISPNINTNALSEVGSPSATTSSPTSENMDTESSSTHVSSVRDSPMNDMSSVSGSPGTEISERGSVDSSLRATSYLPLTEMDTESSPIYESPVSRLHVARKLIEQILNSEQDGPLPMPKPIPWGPSEPNEIFLDPLYDVMREHVERFRHDPEYISIEMIWEANLIICANKDVHMGPLYPYSVELVRREPGESPDDCVIIEEMSTPAPCLDPPLEPDYSNTSTEKTSFQKYKNRNRHVVMIKRFVRERRIGLTEMYQSFVETGTLEIIQLRGRRISLKEEVTATVCFHGEPVEPNIRSLMRIFIQFLHGLDRNHIGSKFWIKDPPKRISIKTEC